VILPFVQAISLFESARQDQSVDASVADQLPHSQGQIRVNALKLDQSVSDIADFPII